MSAQTVKFKQLGQTYLEFYELELTSHRPVSREICPSCFKTIYSMERTVVENIVLHQSCFVCKHCNKKLSLHNYAVYLGSIFCKDHHTLLMKTKENISGSLKGKQNQNDLLNKSIMSNLETSTKTQSSKVKINNYMKENNEKKVTTDPQGNFAVSGQMRTSQRDSCQDTGRKLRIHWPPLQKENKGVTSNPKRPMVTWWPPAASGPSFQTNKTTLIKLDLTINKTQKQKATGEQFLQSNRRAMGSVPITKPGSNITACNMPGDGRRKLQELTEKLKSHNGNNLKDSREVRYRRRLVESTSTFQLPNSMISSLASAPPLSPHTHLKVLKVSKPMTQKPVGKVNRGFDDSSSRKPVNNENVVHVRQSSINTLIPLSKDILQSGISKTDPNLSLSVVSTNSLIINPKLHQDSGNLAIFKNEDLDFHTGSETDTDYSTTQKEESGYVSTCNSESLMLTTEAACGHMNEKLLLANCTIYSNASSNDSERLTFGIMEEVVDAESKRLVRDTTNEEYNVKYPTESLTNITADDKPTTYNEPNGKETEEIEQSRVIETDMGDSKNTLQEIATEKNTDVGEAEFSACEKKETHSQDLEIPDFAHYPSNKSTHQGPIPMRDNVILEVIQSSSGTENLSLVSPNLDNDSAATVQPNKSPTTDHISAKIHKSTEMPAETNIHKPAPPEKTPKIPKISSNFRKSSHHLPNAGENAATVQSLSEVMTTKCTLVTTQVQENRRGMAGKDQSLKSSGFGKNPFSRLFPLDSKDSKSNKEIVANKGQVGAKTQSALGKIFGLSADNSRKEEEVTKSHQKPSEGSIHNDGELSQSRAGLNDTNHTIITLEEKEFIATATIERLMHSDKPEGSFLQPESSDTFLNTKMQARNVHMKELQTLIMSNATESDESLWITVTDNLRIPGKESEVVSLPGKIHLASSSKSIGRVQPNSESFQTKEFQKDLFSISPKPLIVQEDLTSVSLLNLSPERQETLQSENIGTNELGSHCLQSIPQTDGSAGHFRNEDPEAISHISNKDFLVFETSLFGPTFHPNLKKSDLFDMGICNTNIQPNSTTTVHMSETEQQCGIVSPESDASIDSLGNVNNSAPLLDITTDSTADTLCNTGGSHSFLNPELAPPDEAWLPSTGDDDDTFGLHFSVGHSTADHDMSVGESKK